MDKTAWKGFITEQKSGLARNSMRQSLNAIYSKIEGCLPQERPPGLEVAVRQDVPEVGRITRYGAVNTGVVNIISASASLERSALLRASVVDTGTTVGTLSVACIHVMASRVAAESNLQAWLVMESIQAMVRLCRA